MFGKARYGSLAKLKVEVMIVEFLENVDISGKYNCLKGEQFDALEDVDYIMIRMKDDYVVKAPKDAIDKIFKILN